MMETADIHILGGGPAGLTAGYYAKQQNLDFVIYEAGENVGGNCRTLQLDNFRFDTGAHRFHDKDPEVTGEVKQLLGDNLLRVDAPSEIFYQEKFYRFPLTLNDLVEKLETKTLLKIAWDKLRSGNGKQAKNFEELALRRYGKTLAERFLLNYSEKLWGEPTHKLSTAISGNRLKGLDLWSFLRSTVFGTPQNPAHLDGTFFYPKYGIGMIPDKLSEFIGDERIKYNHKVSRLIHKNSKIEKIILNDDIEIEVATVINTLPLTLSMRMLEPAPPLELCTIADTIKYRHLVLCVFCLNRDSFSSNASIYFPSEEFPFTRLYEPKNRSPYMAPEGQTVIVLEIPCFSDSDAWKMSETALRAEVWEALCRVKPLHSDEIIHYQSYKLPFAYPVLEVGFEENVKHLVNYFETFENLHLTGRSSLFRYLHLHDLFKASKEVVEQIQ
ncbi:MAG: FAD-dependent oxidoreductase [Candidatus Poribacteria bacterium]|nr:FAD-dependent oxidoreductase [Candidatus Poribacteria bacterium]